MKQSLTARKRSTLQTGTALPLRLVAILLLLLGATGWASVKPVEIKFRGHMCADVPFTVTVDGKTENGNGQGCSFYSDTDWGTAKLIPEKEYTVSTGGAICSTHIQFDKKCFRLFVKGDPYDDWTETDEIDKYETYDAQGNPQKDAGGSWQIILTNKDNPEIGEGDANLGSVAVGISLGGLASGMPAGTLRLDTESIGAATYSPAMLQAMTLSDDVEVLKAGNDVRQIYTWDGLADVVSVAGGFEVRFYSLADVGTKGGDGFYTIASGATALKIWSFINPDQGSTNRLKVSKISPGTALEFNTYAQTQNTWTLDKGIGSQVRSSGSKAPTTVNGQPAEVLARSQYTGPATFETITTTTYTPQAAAPLSDKTQAIEYADGRKDTFGYEAGTYDPGTHTFTAGSGTFLRQTTTHGVAQNPSLLAGKSTQDVIVTDDRGRVMLEQLYAYTGNGFSLVTQTWHGYDIDGHLVSSTQDGRPIYSAIWQWGEKTSETDESGITTQIDHYDYYTNQPQSLIKVGVPAAGGYAAQPDVETWRNFDYYAGTLSEETVTAGSLTRYSSTWFTYDGRIESETVNELTTDYSYGTSANGGLITTITRPGGGTEIREEHADGKLKSLTGTAGIPAYYTYGIDANGYDWKQVNFGTPASSSYAKTTFDWLGRTIKEESPAYAGLLVREFFYNSKGQLWKETVTGLAARLTQYDEMGNVVRSGLDMDGDGALVLASMDRVEGVDVSYQQIDSDWYRVTTRSAYLADNAATPTTSIEKDRLTLPVSLLSESRSIDSGGNETIRSTSVDRANKLVTETVTVPGSTTAAVTVTRNGVVQSASTTSVSAPTVFVNDALGRQVGITDPRVGTTTAITYDDGQYASDRIATITAGGQSVVQTYHSAQEANPGLLKSRTANGKTTYFDYNTRGQPVHTWGAAAYPTWNEYDSYGRLWKLHTYRTEAGWAAATWPGGAGSGDVATWGYQQATGLLVSKTDAAGKAVTYTYKPFGLVETRTWARGATTTYGYNGAGEVTGVDYSDTTPDLVVTYDRVGNRSTVFDAAGLHTLTYTPRRQLKTDAISGVGILANSTVTVGYDVLSRKETVDVSMAGTPLLHHTFGYDPSTGRVGSAGNGTVSAAYSYLPNSDWLHTIAFSRGASAVMTTTRVPDALDRLVSLAHSVPAQPASARSFGYQYNAQGLRERVTLEDSSSWTFGYNDRSEVAVGQKRWADETPVAGMQFGYTFDASGNRTATETNGRTATYQPNTLNQYSSRDVPGVLDIQGAAAADATVTVNNQPTTRTGGYFYKALTVDNSAAAILQGVTTVGVKNSVGPNGEDAVTSVSGNVFVPKTPEVFTHDDDGNLTSDGRWSYAWDGENRLISLTSSPQAPAASRLKLVFDYDAESRRIRKTVSRWSTLTSSYEQESQHRFLYDGWHLVAEMNSANSLVRTYLWGLDISGSFDEAGGIGGLVALSDYQTSPSRLFFPAFDEAGNVVELIDSSDSGNAASYIYGPFGEMLARSGGYAASNPVTFSSVFCDLESGLYYYGYRFYDPVRGRWLGREPLGEQASANLFRFVENNPVGSVDYLGLVTIPIPGNPIELPWPTDFALPRFRPPRIPKINLRPWRNSQHTMKMKRFPVTADKPISYWANKVYTDLKTFEYFTPNNSRVSMSGLTTAKFRANWPANWAQGMLAAGTSITYWNVVDLTFDKTSYKVTGITQPGHILEGTRSWKAVPADSDCSVTVITSARERSSNLGVEAARLGDIWDHQKEVWTRYFENIGKHWEKTEKVAPGPVKTSP